MSRKESFWVIEVLFLIPVVIFWLGVLLQMVTGSNMIIEFVIGEPYKLIRTFIVTIILPLVAVWYAYDYLKTNKKGSHSTYARTIIVLGIASFLLILLMLLSGNST